MTRRLGSGSLVIATHNAGKLKEISALLEPHGMKCLSAGSLGLPEPAETGTTFVQNAMLKARAAAEASGIVALADDSGRSLRSAGGRASIPRTGPNGSGSKAIRAATGTWRWARSRGCCRNRARM